MRCTHTHTHTHARSSPTHSSTISVHNTLPSDFFPLSFTYFSLATNLSFVFLYPTAVVVVPVVLIVVALSNLYDTTRMFVQ